MRIVSSEAQLASRYFFSQQHEVSESLRIGTRSVSTSPQALATNVPQSDKPGSRLGATLLQPLALAMPRSAADRSGNPAASAAPGAQIELSDAGKAAQSKEVKAMEDAVEEAKKDPNLQLMMLLIEAISGRAARVFDASSLAVDQDAPASAAPASAQPSTGVSVAYDYRETFSEVESSSFSASGVVRTADGKEIAFSLNLAMTRSYHEESSVSLRLGSAVREQKDPLILDFAGNAGALREQRFTFDIDADGKMDSINLLPDGVGFLAFDRNGDGRINDGSELFGALSGNGFADLAAHDDDANGWIDEADAIYQHLRIWMPDEKGGGSLQTLSEADVGAIALSHVNTPFSMRNAANEALGEVRQSGFFLRESGGAGTIQQVDLSV